MSDKRNSDATRGGARGGRPAGRDTRSNSELVPDVVIDWSASDNSSNQRASDSPTSERLQKVLAAAGVASRRVCENLIVAGRVSVNGEIVTELGSRVEPATALVAVDGVAVQLDTTKRYIMLNKPTGVVSSMADGEMPLAERSWSSFWIKIASTCSPGRMSAASRRSLSRVIEPT